MRAAFLFALRHLVAGVLVTGSLAGSGIGPAQAATCAQRTLCTYEYNRYSGVTETYPVSAYKFHWYHFDKLGAGYPGSVINDSHSDVWFYAPGGANWSWFCITGPGRTQLAHVYTQFYIQYGRNGCNYAPPSHP